MSRKKQASSKFKTGNLTQEEIDSLIPKASPDAPVYTRGFVIGVTYSGRSPGGTTKKESPPPSEPTS